MNLLNFKIGIKLKICILGALSVVLMYFRVGLPIFPSFLDFDLSDIPIFFISLVFSPLLGVLALGIKNIIVCLTMGSFTYGVGEFANFLMGSCFLLISSTLYRRLNGRNKYIFGFLGGMIALVLAGVLLNWVVILPIYVKVLGVTLNSLIGEENTLFKFLMIYIVPYNILKSLIIFVPTALIETRFKKINSRINS